MVVGPARQGGCRDHGCGHMHAAPVDHFGIYAYVERCLVPWIEQTFGTKLAQLSGSRGVTTID